MERKALYNSLKIEARESPENSFAAWQIENYRILPEAVLFERLHSLGISLDKLHFKALSEEADSPEELYEFLIDEEPEDQDLSDRIYLLIFELWRRLIPEKQSLSIFCDELDELIGRYDEGDGKSEEPLEIALDTLQNLLIECFDSGDKPKELFDAVKEHTAHDIEPFLYDFISSQIENKDFAYAGQLVEAFLPFVSDTKWFKFLKTRILFEQEPEEAVRGLTNLMRENQKNPDLDLNLELLDFLAKAGEGTSFKSVLSQTLPLLTLEEEFIDVLASAEEYFHYRDKEAQEEAVKQIRMLRAPKKLEGIFSKNDPDFSKLQKLFS